MIFQFNDQGSVTLESLSGHLLIIVGGVTCSEGVTWDIILSGVQ